ncbi:hypothetical protein [Staphylococcus haemolyticus]|uniref:hypothetical protein n=1 Tax=Staphylococcus haemolyticus TaxID=1283 RepID=UPI0020BFF49A|nr:hypothetical protein [Staphylococcus haemolyticus]
MSKKYLKTIKFDQFHNVNDSHKDSFHNLSKDDDNKFYLVQSNNLAFNFDEIHKDFSKQKKCETTTTSDSIYYDDDKYFFIEFKNTSGAKDTFPKALLKKMVGAYFNFNDLLIDEGHMRGNYSSLNYYKVFIMVHSKLKYDDFFKKQKDKNNNKDEDIERNEAHRNRVNTNSLAEKMKVFTDPFLHYLYDEIYIIDDNSFDRTIAPYLDQLKN